jgi:hypothetical protein
MRCDDGCDPSEMRCRQCSADETRCTDGHEDSCSADGRWVSARDCAPLSCDARRLKCQICAPGGTTCSDDRNARVCNAGGTEETPKTCAGGCVAVNDCRECIPGVKECVSGGVRTCSTTGRWDPTVPCDGMCMGAGDCICRPGATRCSEVDSTIQETCGEGNLWLPMSCIDGCVGGACRCIPGATQCDAAGRLSMCMPNERWSTPTACVPESSCHTATCQAPTIGGMPECVQTPNPGVSCGMGGTCSAIGTCETTPVEPPGPGMDASMPMPMPCPAGDAGVGCDAAVGP